MDAWTTASPTRGMRTRTEEKLLAGLREHLRDEQVLAVVRGQTFISPLILPLIAPLLFLFVVKPRTVIITDKSVLTVEESMWVQSKVVRVVSQYPSGSVQVRFSHLGLTVGDDAKVFAMPGSLPAMRQAALMGAWAGGRG
jgi:hypothetical protein